MNGKFCCKSEVHLNPGNDRLNSQPNPDIPAKTIYVFETGDDTGWVTTFAPSFTVETDSPNSGTYNGKMVNTTLASAQLIKNANQGYWCDHRRWINYG
jgi:hypothetical protein